MQWFWLVLGAATAPLLMGCGDKSFSCEASKTCASGVGGEGGESGGSGGGAASGGSGATGGGESASSGGTETGGSGGTGAGGGGAGTGGAMCQEEEALCDGECVDTESSADHCGGCGVECDQGEACLGGSCQLECEEGLVACDDACIDPETDGAFCGASADCQAEAMGVECSESEACVAGECLSADASLAGLSVIGGDLEPVFDPETTEYLVQVPRFETAVSLMLTPSQEESSMLLDGVEVAAGVPAPIEMALLGSLSVEVEVTAPSGAMRLYTVNFERQVAATTYVKAEAAVPGFGGKVVIDGDHMAVVDGLSGVSLYSRSEQGWVVEDRVSPFAWTHSFAFGSSVALSGDTLVVGDAAEASDASGAYNPPDFGQMLAADLTSSGAAYVYRRQASGWEPEAYLKAFNADSGDFFGFNVAVSGDRIAVYARGEESAAEGVLTPVQAVTQDTGAGSAGAVYVYSRVGSTWSDEAYFKTSDASASTAVYGSSLALSGDSLVVSQNNYLGGKLGVSSNELELRQTGTSGPVVFIYSRSQGTWAFQSYLKGYPIGATALGDNFLAIGASANAANVSQVLYDEQEIQAANDAGGLTGSGAVNVFRRDAGVWSYQAMIKAPNAGANDAFGGSVACSGSRLAIGALGEGSLGTGVHAPEDAALSDNTEPGAGAAYVYLTDGTAWTPLGVIKATNTQAGDGFGGSVSISGHRVAVGARFEDSSALGINGDALNDGRTDSGAVYIYE